jgi:hypothetical protein
MRLAVSKSQYLKGSTTPAYKGAWRGHHDGTRADTIWSPRLSPIRLLQGNPLWACLRIRHKLLRPESTMGFPATGPPGRQSAIPPSWATQACWFRTTSLVYPFGISPTSFTPRMMSIGHISSGLLCSEARGGDRPLGRIGQPEGDEGPILDDDNWLQKVGPRCNEGSQGHRCQAARIHDHSGHEGCHLRWHQIFSSRR